MGEDKGSSTANSNYLSSSRWKKQEEVLQDESRLGFARGKKCSFRKHKTPTSPEMLATSPWDRGNLTPSFPYTTIGGKWEPGDQGSTKSGPFPAPHFPWITGKQECCSPRNPVDGKEMLKIPSPRAEGSWCPSTQLQQGWGIN